MVWYILCQHHLVNAKRQNDRDLQGHSLSTRHRETESERAQHGEYHTGQYHVQDVIRRTTLEGQTHRH